MSGLGSWGDMLPLAALARALVSRGAEVVAFVEPAAAELFADTGAELCEVGEAVNAGELLREDPRYLEPRAGMRHAMVELFGPFSAATYRAASELAARRRPQICVSHFSTLGTIWLAKQLGVPSAVIHLAPASLMSTTDPPVLGPRSLLSPRWRGRLLRAVLPLAARAGAKVYAPFAARAGIPGAERSMFEDTQRPDLLIGLWSPRFRGPAADDPPGTVIAGFPQNRPPAAPLDAALEAFLDTGEPALAFGLGSAAVEVGRSFFTRAVEVATALGRRAVLVAGSAAPDELPEEIYAVASVPYDDLLPRCAAFVHHGGVGTSAAALRAGVPSLVTPIGFDHFDNAARIAGLGVGVSVPFAKATEAALRQGLRTILDGEHAVAARALAAELGVEGDGAERAAEAILARAQGRLAGPAG